MTIFRSLFVTVAITLGAVACSSSSSGGSNGDTNVDSGAQAVTCQNDPRVDTYVANLSKTSASGKMKVTLMASDPAPPSKGTNIWTAKVTDASGTPLSGALTIAPFMPDHGHPSPTKPDVANGADGSITISNIYLFMGGVWRITITSGTDSVEFFFCVAG